MPLTFSIANGIALGFISYAAVKLLSGRFAEASPSMIVLALLFIREICLLLTQNRAACASSAASIAGGGSSRRRASWWRPTSDRAREALFTSSAMAILPPRVCRLPGRPVLDAFAGTGALALKPCRAAPAPPPSSRPSATRSLHCAATSRRSAKRDRTQIIAGDATRPPRAALPVHWRSSIRLTIAGLPRRRSSRLAAAGWLTPDALIVIEVAAREDYRCARGSPSWTSASTAPPASSSCAGARPTGDRT